MAHNNNTNLKVQVMPAYHNCMDQIHFPRRWRYFAKDGVEGFYNSVLNIYFIKGQHFSTFYTMAGDISIPAPFWAGVVNFLTGKEQQFLRHFA